jgi:YVTN family beta-propeller protein
MREAGRMGVSRVAPAADSVDATMIERRRFRTTFLWASAVACMGCGGLAAAKPPSPVAPTLYPAAAPSSDGPRAATPREALLVLAKRDHTLAIVDPATLAVIARVPVKEDPHEVTTSADGRTAYVSNYGGGAFNTLSVVDLVAQAPLAPVDLGPLRGAHGLMSRGGKIWFTAEGAKVVGSYDPKRAQVDWVLGTGQDRTHMIFVTDDLRRVVTTNVSSGTVSILEQVTGEGPGNAREHWEQTIVPVARGDEGFDVSPDGKEIWVANAQPGTLSIIDFATKTVTQTLDAGVRGANRLKFTPDGKRALISSLRGGGLVVYDVHTRTLEKRIPLGRGTAGILVQPDGRRAFVACSPDDDVAVIDLQTLNVVGHIAAGHEPDGLAWAAHP